MATRLRADIEALAAIERGSASPGERRSAEWIAGRLGEQGGEEIRLQSFPYQGTFAHAQALQKVDIGCVERCLEAALDLAVRGPLRIALAQSG